MGLFGFGSTSPKSPYHSHFGSHFGGSTPTLFMLFANHFGLCRYMQCFSGLLSIHFFQRCHQHSTTFTSFSGLISSHFFGCSRQDSMSFESFPGYFQAISLNVAANTLWFSRLFPSLFLIIAKLALAFFTMDFSTSSFVMDIDYIFFSSCETKSVYCGLMPL